MVTEIGYHAKRTIEGDVSFLSEKEWRDELAVLLDDLVDEDGNLKRSTDLRSDAGVAWSKVSLYLAPQKVTCCLNSSRSTPYFLPSRRSSWLR